MFTSTLRRLTALNSLVFLLIFLIFTAILYAYLTFRLFDRIDATMRAQAASFRIVGGRFVVVGRPLYDPRIFLLLRTTDGRIINPYPIRSGEAGDAAELAARVTAEKPHIVEYEDHVYRVVSVPFQHQTEAPEGVRIRDVIAVSIVDSETDLLRNLLWIIVGSLIAGVSVIFLAGHFLARRAMIPIEAAWQRQQQFVSDASHELRSPITGIYSNAELMLKHPRHTIEQESVRIDTIMKESMRMTKLITSLLTLARTDANQAELQLAPVDLSGLIRHVADSFKPMEEINNIALHLDLEPGLEMIGDRDRLHQLLVILLDNAFKYNHRGGRVAIAGARADRHILISIEDTGAGIAPRDLPRVFDRFFRGDKARARDSGGAGLGLAIAHWIVDKHRGKIAVESTPGQGTKFTITFPR